MIVVYLMKRALVARAVDMSDGADAQFRPGKPAIM
jgi:hypothetical protein